MQQTRRAVLVARSKVDADHVDDSATKRSTNVFIFCIGCTPTFWFSKKQKSMETSTFGSDFIAMKACAEFLQEFFALKF